MNRTQTVLLIAGAVVLLAAGIGIGWWWSGGSPKPPTGAVPHASDDQRKVLYWYDPMVPDQHFDKPGKSPFMDMMLVPRFADEMIGSGLSIAPGVRQNLGIRTVQVERGRLPGAISVPGTIGWDLRLEEVVSARVDTLIEQVFVKQPFQRVQAGQPLASVLAPEWTTALAEVRVLRDADSAAGQALQAAAEQRLRSLGLPNGARMQDGRIVLSAPIDGVLSMIAAREGASAAAGSLLFRINGTKTVWLEAAIPQADATRIVSGTPVEVRVSSLPGRVFHGHVQTMLPQIEPGSRTRQARIVLENPEGLLTPGMFAEVTLDPEGGEVHLLAPADAVIGAGDRTHVIVMSDEGRFHPVAVQTGRTSGGYTEILSGLEAGARVVASGQFLIDSEASLSGALDRLHTEVPESRTGSSSMSGMDMDSESASDQPTPAPSFPRRRESSASEPANAKSLDSGLRGSDEQKQQQEPVPQGDQL